MGANASKAGRCAWDGKGSANAREVDGDFGPVKKNITQESTRVIEEEPPKDVHAPIEPVQIEKKELMIAAMVPAP